MNNKVLRLGFIAAALMNIGGVLTFSRFFTNSVINDFDPVVMSNFGLLMILVWGLAYLGASFVNSNIKWLAAAFAVLPTILVIIIWGDSGEVVESLLIYSQVFLSIALPISMIPLILLTSNKKIMGEFVNSKITIMFAWLSTFTLVILNLKLIYETLITLF